MDYSKKSVSSSLIGHNVIMTRDDSNSNLRHRKRPDSAPSLQKRIGFEDKTKEKSTKTSRLSPSDTGDTGGYALIPLRQRSTMTRLDVGPFLLSYGLLVASDFLHEPSIPKNTAISLFSLIAFPLILSLHFSLFLVQQWSVSWRATVGYKKIHTSGMRSPLSSKILLSWTHCLVEARNVNRHQSSHDIGLVPVRHSLRQTVGNGSDTEVVAIVNFHDIIFRCNINDGIDADTFLWSTDAIPTRITRTSTTSGLFHRLLFASYQSREYSEYKPSQKCQILQ